MNIHNSIESFYLLIPPNVRNTLNDLKQQKKERFIPKTLTISNPIPFSPVPIALSFNSVTLRNKCIDKFLFVQKFSQSLDANQWIGKTTNAFMQRNILLFIYFIFLSPTLEILQEYIDATIPDTNTLELYRKDDNTLFDLTSVPKICKLFTCEMKEHYDAFMTTNEHRNLFYLDVCGFYQYIIETLKDNFKFEYNQDLSILGHVISHWQIKLIKRTHLISYFENASSIFKYIRNTTNPKLTIIEKDREEKTIQITLFHHLLCYVPVLPNAATQKFVNSVYLGNMPIEYNGKQLNGENKHITTNIPSYKQSVLSEQLITMQLKNWKQIWFLHNWPRSPEIMNRLLFLKPIIKQYLDIPLIVELFFKKT